MENMKNGILSQVHICHNDRHYKGLALLVKSPQKAMMYLMTWFTKSFSGVGPGSKGQVEHNQADQTREGAAGNLKLIKT